MPCQASKFGVQELGPHGLKESEGGDLEKRKQGNATHRTREAGNEACGQTLVMTTRKIPEDASPSTLPLLCLRGLLGPKVRPRAQSSVCTETAKSLGVQTQPSEAREAEGRRLTAEALWLHICLADKVSLPTRCIQQHFPRLALCTGERVLSRKRHTRELEWRKGTRTRERVSRAGWVGFQANLLPCGALGRAAERGRASEGPHRRHPALCPPSRRRRGRPTPPA